MNRESGKKGGRDDIDTFRRACAMKCTTKPQVLGTLKNRKEFRI